LLSKGNMVNTLRERIKEDCGCHVQAVAGVQRSPKFRLKLANSCPN
jgi:hypothetical protein